MRPKEEVSSVCAGTGGRPIWFKKGGDVLGFFTVEYAHKAASRLRTGGPFHMFPPEATTTAFAFFTVTELGGSKPGDVGGSRAASFQLKKAFHPCPKIPHPLGEPRVLWVPVVARSIGAALVECTIDGMCQL